MNWVTLKHKTFCRKDSQSSHLFDGMHLNFFHEFIKIFCQTMHENRFTGWTVIYFLSKNSSILFKSLLRKMLRKKISPVNPHSWSSSLLCSIKTFSIHHWKKLIFRIYQGFEQQYCTYTIVSFFEHRKLQHAAWKKINFYIHETNFFMEIRSFSLNKYE